MFWSPNITLGVNYLLFASRYLKKIAPWVDIEIIEEHFKDKQGLSGTAIKIADALDISKEEINSIRAVSFSNSSSYSRKHFKRSIWQWCNVCCAKSKKQETRFI